MKTLVIFLASIHWILPQTTRSQSVQINSSLTPTCGGYSGTLQAVVSGGTGPYFYVWYVDQQSYGYGQSLSFNGMGIFYGGVVEVFVSEGGSPVGTALLNVPYITPAQIDQVHQPDHSAGSPALIGVSSSSMFATSVSGGPGMVASGMNGTIGYVAFNGAPGSSVQINLSSAECGATTNAFIQPPSILPDIGVVDVVGSCAASPTGKVTLSVFNGNTNDGLRMHLRGSNGIVTTSPIIYSIPATIPFNNIPAGTYWAVLSGLGVSLPGLPYTHKDSVQVTIPALGPCGIVQGQAYVDNNLNCTKQFNEPGVPSLILKMLPGPYYTTTDVNGNYVQHLPIGSYTIEQVSDVVGGHCSTEPVAITIAGGTPAVVNFADTSSVPLDLRITMGSGVARPGFSFQYGINVKNLTPASSGVITITMEFDPLLQFQSSDPAPTSVNGNTLTWQQTTLFAWQQRNITINFLVPADPGQLGTVLVSSAAVTSANADGNLDNNSASNFRVITGAFDPNDKLAYTSSGSWSEFDPGEDDWIDYTIRFQNTGTDTAFHVVITDTISPDLDPGSIQIGAGSHPFTWQLRDEGTLKFYFANILLPDSNANEPESHGFVSFRIRPHDPQNLQAGDQIVNTANIFFDFNPPVITDPSVLTVPTSGVQVNVKVTLGGPYNSSTGMMNDQLRSLGLLPLNEPYSAFGYTFVNSGTGTTTAAVLATIGPDAIVDWMILELRSPSQPQTIVASKPVLLQRDGDLVQADGSAITFAVPDGQYHVAVKHRNHLGVMTAAPIALSGTSSSIDFTSSATATWGTAARRNMAGTMVLWPGDTNFDGSVSYMGAGNDRDPMLQMIAIPTQVVTSTYSSRDVDLDGVMKYTGANNDRDLILQTIGGLVPTAVRVGQLP